MAKKIDSHTIPLRDLSFRARDLLTCLLKANKLLPTDGPDKLPRDWRGLASLVNISAEIASSLDNHQDRVGKVLELWIQRGDGTATLGQLFVHLQKLDRYDVYDDLEELLQKGELIVKKNGLSSPHPLVPSLGEEETDLITYQDSEHGTPQYYHAYVLYANEDKDFVDELLRRMAANGYKLCTENDLLPGHATKYAPVTRLISERCHRIILIYSPEFLKSPANAFFMNHAQAVGIEMNRPKIIPCMYRQCQLPPNLSYYHKLYYTSPGERTAYDFWEMLAYALAPAKRIEQGEPRSRTPNSSIHSGINITEVDKVSSDRSSERLALPSVPSSEPQFKLSDSNHNEVAVKKKKKFLRGFFSGLTGKKHKEKKEGVIVAN